MAKSRFLMAVSMILVPLPALGQGMDQLWANNCVNCHGDRGQGGGAGTRTLLTDELFDQSLDRPFFDAIKNGRPEAGMEAFGATLNDAQVWGLVVHIRELQARERRQRRGSPKSERGVYETSLHKYLIEEVVAEGLDTPWAVDFLPDGRMLVTERPGLLRIHSTGKAGGTLGEPVTGTPEVRNQGQGGLMDVALHPDYSKNGWLYLSFSHRIGEGRRSPGMTKVVRGRLVEASGATRWADEETVFRARDEHYLTSDIHFGCKLAFDPHDSSILFFGIGERGHMEMAQSLERPNGKIHRVHDDGRIPSDNPFVGREGAYESIWSFGHRNPQGLVFDLEGKLWDTEHGPRGGDEVNLIEKGRNYGWPTVSFGINYSDAPFRTPWSDVVARDAARGHTGEVAEIAMPADRWMPSIGACGLDVVRGEEFPEWKGDLVAGGLSGANVDRVRVKDGKVVEREEIFHGHGRVRDVVCGPDGSVYVVLNDPHKVVRLVVAK